MIAADDKLILFNDRGEVILARQGGVEYQELARCDVFAREVCWTSPALSDGRLFLRTQSRAVCLGLGHEHQQLPSTLLVMNAMPHKQWNWTRLVGGERNAPLDPPSDSELTHWFSVTMGGLLAASLLALLMSILRSWSERVSRLLAIRRWLPNPETVYWLIGGLFGIVGSAALNSHLEQFVFTWPLVLALAFQKAMVASVETRGLRFASRRRLLARGQGWVFVGICLLYGYLCRRVGLAVEPVFLIGFIPAFPVSLLIAYQIVRGRHRFAALIWGNIVTYSVFFWSCSAFIHWRLTVN